MEPGQEPFVSGRCYVSGSIAHLLDSSRPTAPAGWIQHQQPLLTGTLDFFFSLF